MVVTAWVWLVGCTSTPTPVTPDVPTPAAEPVAVEPTASNEVYVQASTLNLREEPTATGRKLGSLTVNSPLEVLERRDGWLRVRVGNGREGWVADAFTGPEPLTAATAVANAGTGTPAERLSWWQRAAVLDGSRPTLEGLAAAYEAVGDSTQAARIREQLAWPVALFLPSESFTETPALRVEWHASYDLGRAHVVPRARWAGHGIDPDEVWWVLPASGPAVEARVKAVVVEEINECGGEQARLVELDAPGLQGRAVAMHRGAPPASWREPAPRPPVDEATARQSADALARDRARGADVHLSLVPTADAWVGTAWWATGEIDELGGDVAAGIGIRVDGAGARAEALEAFVRHETLAVRDLRGDGTLLQVRSDGCATLALTMEGDVVEETANTCCGC